MTYQDFLGLPYVQEFVQNPERQISKHRMFQLFKLRTYEELIEFSKDIKDCHHKDLYGLLPMIENIIENGLFAKN